MFTDRYPNLKRLKPYFMRQKRLLIVLLACMLTASSMGVLLSYLMSRQMIAITDISTRGMVMSTVLILITVSIHHITWFFWGKLSAVIGNRVAQNIRRDMFEASLNAKYLKVRANTTGYYLERLNEDVNEVSYFVQNVAGTLVDVFTNVSFLVIIYVLSPYCGIIFTVGIAFLYMIDLLRIKVELKHTRAKKLINESLDSRMTEVIRAIKDIKNLGIKSEVVRMNDEISIALAKCDTRMQRDIELLSRVRTYTQWVIDALLVLACAFWFFPTGRITVVALLIVFNYKGLMYDTVGFFSKLKGYYVQGDFKASRILEIIQSDDAETFGAAALPAGPCRVDITGLSFSYNSLPLLNNVSFTLRPGTATALTGMSGSGKSTLIALLTRLIAVDDGKIAINGVDINSISEKSLTDHISTVNQEPFLFSDTIRRNLTIVRQDATDAEIRRACERAHIWTEISEMPNGLDTVLTENGSNLSGGQKQRLSIARALLKDTPVILFDEPTSALDSTNQQLFMDTIAELKQEKALLIITHNVADLSIFDQVLEVRSGSIFS